MINIFTFGGDTFYLNKKNYYWLNNVILNVNFLNYD